VSAAGDFVDAALQREGDQYRASEAKVRLASDLHFYGASVGAVRGTVRDAGRRYPGLTHDEVTALSSELWARPVFERRLAAVVLLQSNVGLLVNSDLTRIEGFVREAQLKELVDPLAAHVVGPLMSGLQGHERQRAEAVIGRWARETNEWLRRAAMVSQLRIVER
jgi:3-methyladenine DNA glycosylase AlkD